jgi:PadR family transcriptional regulator, regulatory protein PadR
MHEHPVFDGELLKGNTPTLVLAVLANGPRHGYAIVREIELRSDRALSPGEGSIYPTLRALERDGHIAGRWEAQASGRERKVYALTDSGRTELARRELAWSRFCAAVNGVLGRSPNVEPA